MPHTCFLVTRVKRLPFPGRCQSVFLLSIDYRNSVSNGCARLAGRSTSPSVSAPHLLSREALFVITLSDSNLCVGIVRQQLLCYLYSKSKLQTFFSFPFLFSPVFLPVLNIFFSLLFNFPPFYFSPFNFLPFPLLFNILIFPLFLILSIFNILPF